MFPAGVIFLALGLLLWKLGPARDDVDFLSAGGTLPAWAAALWFASAEASAMTVLGVPAAAFGSDWRYLQFFAGSAAARLFLAVYLLPSMAAGKGPTAYAWLEARFGLGGRRWSAAAFVVARMTVTAVRLMAAASALYALAGGSKPGWIAALALAAGVAACWGGLRGVVYAGAAQALALTLFGGFFAAYAALAVDGGPFEALRLAEAANKLAVWRWLPDGPFFLGLLHDRDWAPAAMAGGLIGSLAAFAGDQEMMQGALNSPSGEGRRSIIGSVFASLALLAVYLGLGTMLYAFYDQHSAMALPDRAESILPHFVAQNMGPGWRALLAAALIAAVMDLPLIGTAAALLSDLGLGDAAADSAGRLRRARYTVAGTAAACALGAWLVLRLPWLAPAAARISTAVYAPVLGLVLYGVFGPRTARRAAIPAAAVGTLTALAALGVETFGDPLFGWHWVPLISVAVTIFLVHRFGDDASPST